MKNEYIAWFPNMDRFMREEEASQHLMDITNGRLVFNIDELENGHDDVLEYYSGDGYSIHEYIGKKDINDNKIYANCSIVEFDWRYCTEINFTKHRGFFYFDKKQVCYRVETVGKFPFDIIYAESEIANLKIIGTIQENKLGLIK